MTAVAPYLRPIPDNDTRMPPASLDAERAAIGAVVLRQELLAELEELLVDDFFWPAHREIWESVKAMHEHGQKLDHIAIEEDIKSRGALAKLEGGGGYLLACADAVIHTENAGVHARIIREKAGLRRAIYLGMTIQSRAYGGLSLDEVLAEARNGVADLENAGVGQGPVRVGDEVMAAFENIEDKHRNPERYAVMTGIKRFDERLGGLRPGRLIVVAAPPGVGKTALAGTIAVNSAFRQVPALILSVEMDRQELIERFLAGMARVSTQEIGSGEICNDVIKRNAVWGAAAKFHEANVPLFIDDREVLTTSQAVGTIRRWYAKHVGSVPPPNEPPLPAIVAIDYLQLLSADEGGNEENRNLVVAGMTRAFKRVAKGLRIPVLLLSQLSRAWVKRGGKPVLSDLRDSGAIEQDADQVIFPWREPEKDEEGREVRNGPGKAELLVAKNRGGVTGSIPVWWEPQFTRFENTTDFERGDG